MLKFKGTVLRAFVEDRELVGKDGTKRQAKIAHVLMLSGKGAETVPLNIRAYDPVWALPEIGKEWETPAVKKYENYDGMTAEVQV